MTTETVPASDAGSQISDNDYMAWKGWSATTGFGALTPSEAAYFSKELRGFEDVRTVLEVGFGQGAFLSYAKRKGWQVRGTERNGSLVAAARAAGFEVFRDDEIEQIDAASVDLVVAFDVLEHIPPAEAGAFLASLRGKLRPGGRLLMRFPNADHWLGNVGQHGDPTHVNAIGYYKLQCYAVEAGLVLDSFDGQARIYLANGAKRAVHALLATPIIVAMGWFHKALHYPSAPFVLDSQNVVAVLRRP